MSRNELAVLLARVDHAELAVKNAWTLFDQTNDRTPVGRAVAHDVILSPAFGAQRRAYESLVAGVREFLSTGGK